MTAWRAALSGLLVIVALLAGCSRPHPPAPRPAPHPPARSPAPSPSHPAAPRPVSMQLPAHTSIGTGPLAAAWAKAILTALGAPASTAGVTSIIAWFAAEDDHRAAGQYTYGAGENDPLNLTAYSANSAGVVGTEPSGAGPAHPGNLDFSTPARGVTATAWVIKVKYPAIGSALTSGRGLLGNPAVAADLSKWSGGGYSALR